MPAPSRLITVDDLAGKTCWICAESEDDELSLGERTRFVHPCGCTLVAHETCLFSWIDTQQKASPGRLNLMGAGGGGRAGGQDPNYLTPARCPQCQQPYQLTDGASKPERWLHNLLSTVADKVASSAGIALGASLGAGAYVVCTAYGRSATRLLIGRSLADRVFNRPWAWHLHADVPLLPFILVLMRLPVLLDPSYWVLPTLLMLPFVHRSSLTPGSRLGVDGFTRRLLRGDLSSFPTTSTHSGLWPPSPATTLLLIPWARVVYFPLRRAVYRLLFRSWYRAEAARRTAALALPRPRPSAARHLMNAVEEDAVPDEDEAAGDVLNDGGVREILRITNDEEQHVYLTTHGRVRVEWLVALEQPPPLALDDEPFSVSAEHGREPYTDPGIVAEDVTFKNWERRTVQYPSPAYNLTADARRALEVLDTLLAVGDDEEVSEAERRAAAALRRSRAMLASNSSHRRPALRVEYYQMDEVHRLYITPASVMGLIFGGLTLPLFASAGGSMFLYISNFIPCLRRLLGLSSKKLALGTAFGSAVLGTGLSSPTYPPQPQESNDWSVWDTLTGEDPVWWRNALGAALWIATRDIAVATLRLLRSRNRRSRHLKSLPFAPSQLDNLALRPGRQFQVSLDSTPSTTPTPLESAQPAV